MLAFRAPHRPLARLERTRSLHLLVALPLLVASATASAAPTQPKAGPKKPVAAADPNEQRALELFEQGRKAYKEGRYDDAVTLLKQSYELKQEPVLQYNLARAYESLGRLDEAVTAFQRYLDETQEIPDRVEIAAKVQNLKARIEADQKAKAPPPPPTPKPTPTPAPDEGAKVNPVPWVLAGVGGLGLIAGGVVGALASSKNDEVATASSQVEGQSLRDSAESLALGSNLALGIGGAVLLGGAIWGVVDLVGGTSSKAPEPAKAGAIDVRVGLGAATFTLTL